MTHYDKKGKFHMSKRIAMAVLLIIVLIIVLILGIDLPSEKSSTDDIYKLSDDNKLIVYTAHKPEIYEPIIQEFEEETGIWVELVSGGTSQMLERIASESDAPVADIMFGGGVDSLDSYSAYFEPYVSSNAGVLDTSYASSDNSYTVFSSLPTVFIYNTKLISYDDRPVSWAKLLSGDYEGEVAFADPTTSGSSYTALMTMLQVMSDSSDDDIIKLFMDAIDYDVLDSSTDVVTEVIAGRKTIGITTEEVARKNMAMGTSIEMIYPEDGTAALPDGCAIVKGAAHLDNARAFIDFVTGSQVQSYLAQYQYRRSVRNDIETDSDINVIIYDINNATSMRSEILNKWSSYIDTDDTASDVSSNKSFKGGSYI